MYSSNINASDPLFLQVGEFVNKMYDIQPRLLFNCRIDTINKWSTIGSKILPLSSICVGDQATQGQQRATQSSWQGRPLFPARHLLCISHPPLVHYPAMVVLSPPASHLVRESPINGRQTRRTGDDLRPPRQYQNQQGLPTHGNQVPWWSQGSPMSTVTVSKPEPMSKSCIREAPKTISGDQGCISCGPCSYPELTKDHVLPSA